jgi:hypothetical protein
LVDHDGGVPENLGKVTHQRLPIVTRFCEAERAAPAACAIAAAESRTWHSGIAFFADSL